LAAVSKRRFRVFEAGYRKDYKNWKVISMEQKAKILSLIFSSTKKQNIVKTISVCTEGIPITYTYY
jgi:hypothetical protein